MSEPCFDAALWLFSVRPLCKDFNSIMFQIFMDGQKKYSDIYKKKMLKLNLQRSLSFFLEYIILYWSSIKQESAYTHTKERENPHEKVWTALSPQNQLIPVTRLVIYSLILSLTYKHHLVVNCFSHPSCVGGSALYQLFVMGFSAACQQDFHSISWKILRKKTQCYTCFR